MQFLLDQISTYIYRVGITSAMSNPELHRQQHIDGLRSFKGLPDGSFTVKLGDSGEFVQILGFCCLTCDYIIADQAYPDYDTAQPRKDSDVEAWIHPKAEQFILENLHKLKKKEVLTVPCF